MSQRLDEAYSPSGLVAKDGASRGSPIAQEFERCGVERDHGGVHRGVVQGVEFIGSVAL